MERDAVMVRFVRRPRRPPLGPRIKAWLGCAATFCPATFVSWSIFLGAYGSGLCRLDASTLACSNTTTVVVVIGAPGVAEYQTNFLKQARQWEQASAQAGCRCVLVGDATETQTNACARLQQFLADESKDLPAQLWVVLVGHGTFDGREARFNLPGPDLSATDLALWLKPFHRPLAVIDGSSSSAPFLNALSATNRVIITATRSGHEQNYARFGEYFSVALTDLKNDLDKDGQVSLLEAFLAASRRTAEFYKAEGRLVTEHALLDDNGDGLGTPADWFQGLRAVRKAKEGSGVDGPLASQFCLIPSVAERTLSPAQRDRRDALERAVFLHREKKAKLSEDDYYRELERLLIELARLSATNSNSSARTTP